MGFGYYSLFPIPYSLFPHYPLATNHCPLHIRDLYKDFHIVSVRKHHKFANTKGVAQGYDEVLIGNYELRDEGRGANEGTRDEGRGTSSPQPTDHSPRNKRGKV